MAEKIILKAGEETITADLTDTVAAHDFLKRLPLTACCSRGNCSYFCSVAIGRFDPEEKQCGWRNGDISVAGGFMDIFFSGEEESKDEAGIMVVAHIDEEALSVIEQLPENAKFIISK